MAVRRLAVLACLVLPSLAASAPPFAKGTLCRPAERVVYACSLGRKVVSVCAAPGLITYRFGRPGRPELEIPATPASGVLHVGTVVGGGGGSQQSLRFSHAGVEYIVFSAVAGSLTDVPGKRWSGVYVARGERQLAALACPSTGKATRISLDAALGDFPEEDNPAYEAWF